MGDFRLGAGRPVTVSARPLVRPHGRCEGALRGPANGTLPSLAARGGRGCPPYQPQIHDDEHYVLAESDQMCSICIL